MSNSPPSPFGLWRGSLRSLRSRRLVRPRRLELPRGFPHQHLKLARLPIPPWPHKGFRTCAMFSRELVIAANGNIILLAPEELGRRGHNKIGWTDFALFQVGCRRFYCVPAAAPLPTLEARGVYYRICSELGPPETNGTTLPCSCRSRSGTSSGWRGSSASFGAD